MILGEYIVTRTKSISDSLIVLLIICAGFGVGYLISDMIVRGLVFNHFHKRVSFGMLIVITVILYTLDDIWVEGLTFDCILGQNLVCSSIHYRRVIYNPIRIQGKSKSSNSFKQDMRL